MHVRSPVRWSTAGAALLAMLLLVVSCGGDSSTTDPGGGAPPAQTPDFTLAVAPTSLSVNQGASGNVTVSIAPAGGFSAAVAVTVEGLPQGVTAGALTLAAGSTSGTLTLSAASNAATGNATLTVRGTATGVQPKTATLTLTVNAVAQPNFTLSMDPGTVSVEAGQSGTSTVTIARTGGFTGAVALTATGLPAGVSATFDPSSVTGGTSTLTLTTQAAFMAAQTAAGTYTVNVQGNATGIAEKTASLSLVVTAPPPPPPPSGNTVWEFCEAGGLPLWVAVQDGDGPWTRVTGTDGRFTFQVDAARGGVAWVTPEASGGFSMEIFYGTRNELEVFGVDRCGGNPGEGKTVTASVPGLNPTDVTVVTLGGRLPDQTPTSAAPNITFRRVRSGSVDLLGGRSSLDLSTLQIVPQRFLIRRGLNPADGSSLGNIDFNGEGSFAPVASPLTVTGAGGASIVTTTNYSTAQGTFGNLTVGLGGAGTSWAGVPANQQQAGDLHFLTVTAADISAPLQPSRTTVVMTAAAGALSVEIGPQLNTATVQPLAGTGFARARAQLPIQTQYDRYWVANFQQPGPTHFRSTTVNQTQGYRGSSAGTAELEIPEFAGVAGWDPQWGLRTGAQVTWTVSALGWNQAGGIVSAPWADGNRYLSASRMGQFTP